MRTRKKRGNIYLVGKTTSYIRISNKLFPFDTEDFNLVKPYTWHISGNNYIVSDSLRRLEGKRLYFHRLVMNTSEDLVVDHLDGNKLNNRKSNLRNCTSSENNYNVTTKNMYRGVTYCKQMNKYRAKIKRNYKTIHLGYFDTPQEAHKEYLKYIEDNNIFIR